MRINFQAGGTLVDGWMANVETMVSRVSLTLVIPRTALTPRHARMMGWEAALISKPVTILEVIV